MDFAVVTVVVVVVWNFYDQQTNIFINRTQAFVFNFENKSQFRNLVIADYIISLAEDEHATACRFTPNDKNCCLEMIGVVN